MRKGGKLHLIVFLQMPACLERGVMLHLSSNDALCGGFWECGIVLFFVEEGTIGKIKVDKSAVGAYSFGIK